MDWEGIEIGWKSYKSNAKERWAKLSNAQLDGTAGKREQLSLKVQQAYSISNEETEKQISEWQARQNEQQPAMQAAKR